MATAAGAGVLSPAWGGWQIVAPQPEICLHAREKLVHIFLGDSPADMSDPEDLAPQLVESPGNHHLPLLDQIAPQIFDIHSRKAADSRDERR